MNDRKPDDSGDAVTDDGALLRDVNRRIAAIHYGIASADEVGVRLQRKILDDLEELMRTIRQNPAYQAAVASDRVQRTAQPA